MKKDACTARMGRPREFDVDEALAEAHAYFTTGSAQPGSDYDERSLANRFIDAGRTRQVFEVALVGDTLPEPDEFFYASLGGINGAVFGGNGIGTIANDEPTARAGATRTRTIAPPAAVVPGPLGRG